MQAVAQITIWLKVFTLFKVIFRFSYFIQMIAASMKQIIPFLVVLSISVFALGGSIFMVSKMYIANTDG